jgi:alcohol dehydrogenase (cytochrome c)
MYLTIPGGGVAALDAASGDLRWRYDHELRGTKLCCGKANRGAALGYGKVYVATPDAQLVALEAGTGAVAWTAAIADEVSELAESLSDLADDDPLSQDTRLTGGSALGASMAPLVYHGRVYVGVTGAGYGLHVGRGEDALTAVVGVRGRPEGRGYLAAFNAHNGRPLWRWYSVPESGWEGDFVSSTADGLALPRNIEAERAAAGQYPDAWRGGGGSIWTTPSLDPKEGLLYLGTGNPSPQMDGASRLGDNLYTSSIVAIDAATGEIRWHHQQVPHDRWGYDVASPSVLFDWISPEGEIRKALAQASKTGWLYIHDRLDGSLLSRSRAFVPQENLFTEPTPEGVRVVPGGAGGSSWSPVSFDPRTGNAFVSGVHLPMFYQVRESQDPAQPSYTKVSPLPEEAAGRLVAVDTTSGELRWEVVTEQPLIGGALATAGDLVFSGNGDGRFNAYNSETGALLWSFRCGAGVNAPPISFEVGGRQFVAVAAGGHTLFRFPLGDTMIAFALPPVEEKLEETEGTESGEDADPS